MSAESLKCASCGAEHELGLVYFCRKCQGTLDVSYDHGGVSFARMLAAAEAGIWKYRDVLPVGPDAEPVTMREGDTPLLSAERLGEVLGVPRLYLKNETVNPTLSFKDRPLSVALTKAREFGTERIVVASTGNTAVSASAYSARAGMSCCVYVPAGTPREKTALIALCGAEVRAVPGTFSDAYETALRDVQDNGAFNVTSTFLNPYACEGDKTVSYEIFRDLGDVPDWIVVPVGAGPLLVYAYKGFVELKQAGLIDRLPRMVAVQAEGCSPIARAYSKGQAEVKPWLEPRTIATGVADPLATYPRDGTRTLAVVRRSNGYALSVGEQDILAYVRLLAEREAILAEPAAALSVAAVDRMARMGLLEPSHRVVSIITGHGLKDVEALLSPADAQEAE